MLPTLAPPHCLFFFVLPAQTTIEFYRNKVRARRGKLNGRLAQNEYDLGRRRNWEAVFGRGRHWWSWAMPSCRVPDTDGTRFPTVYDPTMSGAGRHHLV